MIRTIVLGSFAAAAFAVGGLASVPAQAQPFPTYTCDHVVMGFRAEGIGNCEPSNGAVPAGPFFGPSFLVSRDPGESRVLCHEGGFARVPVSVLANHCFPVNG